EYEHGADELIESGEVLEICCLRVAQLIVGEKRRARGDDQHIAAGVRYGRGPADRICRWPDLGSCRGRAERDGAQDDRSPASDFGSVCDRPAAWTLRSSGESATA